MCDIISSEVKNIHFLSHIVGGEEMFERRSWRLLNPHLAGHNLLTAVLSLIHPQPYCVNHIFSHCDKNLMLSFIRRPCMSDTCIRILLST